MRREDSNKKKKQKKMLGRIPQSERPGKIIDSHKQREEDRELERELRDYLKREK